MVDFLAPTDDARLLRQTAVRVFADPARMAPALAESGLLCLPFAMADGGLADDGSADRRDLAIAFAAKGETHGIDTQLLQAVLGGGLVAASTARHRAAILSGIMAGSERVATGLHEPGARTDILHCATSARRQAGGWRLDGRKTLVLGAAQATRLLVLARVAPPSPDRRDGLGLFLVDPATDGVALRHYRLRDGSPASDLVLSQLQLADEALILGPDVAATALDSVLAPTRLCLAAEAAGLIGGMLAGTAAYVAERRQFGQPIGAFQVVQHRLAELAMQADQSAALVAAVAADIGDHAAITRAHAAIAEMGMAAAKTAIQLHGGYGMTEDLPYGQALRRMMTIALLF